MQICEQRQNIPGKMVCKTLVSVSWSLIVYWLTPGMANVILGMCSTGPKRTRLLFTHWGPIQQRSHPNHAHKTAISSVSLFSTHAHTHQRTRTYMIPSPLSRLTGPKGSNAKTKRVSNAHTYLPTSRDVESKEVNIVSLWSHLFFVQNKKMCHRKQFCCFFSDPFLCVTFLRRMEGAWTILAMPRIGEHTWRGK